MRISLFLQLFIAYLSCLLMPTLAMAQTCLPPTGISIALQAGVANNESQIVDSLYVQWSAIDSAVGYSCEVWLDDIFLFNSSTANNYFSFSLLPMGWNSLAVHVRTLCDGGGESAVQKAAIVATVDEVYKVYQQGECNSLNTCSECLCEAMELLLESAPLANDTIENSEFLGNTGCAGFLNRFLQFNNAQLQSLCPCYVPKADCYDNYPCNGFNCTTGLRETPMGNNISWRIQNNMQQGYLLIEYAIPKPQTISIRVYDYMGHLVAYIAPEHPLVGLHREELYLPRKGTYIIELQADNAREIKKAIALW